MRTVPDHVLWCSAEGTPPIKISFLGNSRSLSKNIGMVMTRAEKEGIYTCLATNEVGSDLKEFPVTFVGASVLLILFFFFFQSYLIKMAVFVVF